MGNGRRSAFAFLIANIYLPLPSVSPCQMYYPHANEGKRHARAQRMKHEASPLPRFVLSKNERVNNKNLWRGIVGGAICKANHTTINRSWKSTNAEGGSHSFLWALMFVCFGWLNFTDCLGCGCGRTMEGNKQNNIADTDGWFAYEGIGGLELIAAISFWKIFSIGWIFYCSIQIVWI